jgi:hypothetical protein
VIVGDGESLEDLKEKQIEQFATNPPDLGMPILDVSMGDEPIISGGVVSAEGYDPIVITKTEENTPKDP